MAATAEPTEDDLVAQLPEPEVPEGTDLAASADPTEATARWSAQGNHRSATPRRDQALALAASTIGEVEQPLGSNRTRFSAWYGITGAWCAMWYSWVLAHSGTPVGPHAKGFAWCSDGERWFEQQGRLTRDLAAIQPGDALFYEWGTTAGGLDHIGMALTAPDGGGVLETIEGNVSDGVRHLRRNIRTSGIVSAGRPDWGASTGPVSPASTSAGGPRPTLRRGSTGDHVRRLQAALNVLIVWGLQVDGSFGEQTHRSVVELQRRRGIEADGVVGPQTWAQIDAALAEAQATPDPGTEPTPAPEPAPGPPGHRWARPEPTLRRGSVSNGVIELQRALNLLIVWGLADDGTYGPRTEACVAELQRRRGITADGVYGPDTAHQLDLALAEGGH